MRILFCNKYNYPFSGTEVYLFELMDLLRAHGHEVALFSMADSRGNRTPYDHNFVTHIDFKSKSGLVAKTHRMAHAIYSTEARQKLRAMIREFQPDVAHVRNIYHHLSPSILWELKAQGVPVLYHLNDFKLLCPSYNMVSQGHACESCKGGRFWHALHSQCYPDLSARLALTTEAYVHQWLGTYRQCVDLLLAPSRFVRDKFVEHGWDSRNFEVLPHFQEAKAIEPVPFEGPILYVGRLSAEKGVDDLIRAMAQLPNLRLIVAGDGPERAALEHLTASLHLRNVSFAGQVTARQRDQLIRQSLFTVLPSHAYETLGKTILESYALGRPVVASDIGSRRELVQEGKTGLLYRCGDVSALAAAIQSLAADPERTRAMGRNGWEWVRRDFTPESHYQQIYNLYEELRKRKVMRKTFMLSNRGAQENSESRKLRIAFIGGRGVVSKYSGIESYYEEVGKRLAEKGHDVTIYCRSFFTPGIAEHNGMKLVRFPTIRSKHLETVVHTFLSTAHALTQPYDLVHYHALGPAFFSFLPRLFRMKTAVTVQGLDWQRKKWGRFASAVLRLGEKASVRLPNGTMVVSHALQDRYKQVHGAETFYLPNGGVLRERSKPRMILEWGLEPGRYVLFLGRFSPEKGCHLLVEAFEQIHTDVKLVMAGGSSYSDEYSQRLREHASDRIRILDWVSGDALDELLTNAMIFVLPSDLEGLSLALLDAMGAGLCVLTSDVPENLEVVEGAGFMFERGSASDLADRLQFLISNPAIREAAGRNARKRIEQEYQWQKIADDIERSYYEILDFEVPDASSKKAAARAMAAAASSSNRRAS
ncbi:MAG TPA: glycosyltransferase family 4 protein [Candidatus Sulfotelmatobacter sp.]|nr:glycosyltransferase family 4 protein [Candidatus Sulfotelmatobacter sp.]